jgi:hypothetical protein
MIVVEAPLVVSRAELIGLLDDHIWARPGQRTRSSSSPSVSITRRSSQDIAGKHIASRNSKPHCTSPDGMILNESSARQACRIEEKMLRP